VIPLSDIKLLNGKYKNYPLYENIISDCHNIDLNDSNAWIQGQSLNKLFIHPFHIYIADERRNYDGEIEIEVLSNKKLKITYIKHNEIIEEKIVRGSVNGNFFSIKMRAKFWAYLLINGFAFDKVDIAVSSEGNLIILNGWGSWGFLFPIIPVGNNDSFYSYYFERINKINTQCLENLAKEIPCTKK
jgi:hypothetical protein